MARAYLQRAREETVGSYLLPICTAMAISLTAGFALGTTVAFARAVGWGAGGRLGALVQAHGHAQLMGWAGLFILGMAYRLVPRFTASSPVAPLPFFASFLALGTGVMVRVIGQPLATGEVGKGLLLASGGLEATGAAIFAYQVGRRLWRRPGAPFTPHLASMAWWLLMAKALALAWAFAVPGMGPAMYPFGRNQALVTMEMVGFVLCAVIGVSLRTVFIFFGRQLLQGPTLWAIWAPLQAGLFLYLAVALWRDAHPDATALELEATAHMLMGLGLASPALLSAFWRPPLRLRALSREPGRLVQMAMGWLALGGVMLTTMGAISLAHIAPLELPRLDAIRHVLGTGTITTMILGMAYLVLPPFALARQRGLGYRWAVRVALVALPSATALRALGSWMRGKWGVADHLAGWGGALAWTAVATFAIALAQAMLQRDQEGGS